MLCFGTEEFITELQSTMICGTNTIVCKEDKLLGIVMLLNTLMDSNWCTLNSNHVLISFVTFSRYDLQIYHLNDGSYKQKERCVWGYILCLKNIT